MTTFSAKRRRAAEVRVSAEKSRFENDKFRLRGTERGDCPVPTPSAGGLSPHPYHENVDSEVITQSTNRKCTITKVQMNAVPHEKNC